MFLILLSYIFRVSDKKNVENEVRNDVLTSGSFTSTSRRQTSSSQPDLMTNTLTSTTSHPRSSKARRHSVRHIQDIRVTDLETPRSRRNCVNVMHYETKVMKNKIHTLQKQNTRLRKKVRSLDALEKFRQENLVSSGRIDELLVRCYSCTHCINLQSNTCVTRVQHE